MLPEEAAAVLVVPEGACEEDEDGQSHKQHVPGKAQEVDVAAGQAGSAVRLRTCKGVLVMTCEHRRVSQQLSARKKLAGGKHGGWQGAAGNKLVVKLAARHGEQCCQQTGSHSPDAWSVSAAAS